jgi:hypothetical protein
MFDMPPAAKEHRMSEELSIGTRHQRRPHGITGGLILIALGVIFLLQQWGHFDLQNWWAIFILIPALSSFASTYAIYQHTGTVNRAVIGNFFGAVMILTVAFIFLFNLSWGVFWPFFIILPGLSMFLTGLPFGSAKTPALQQLEAFGRPWLMGTGLGVVLLGTGFLVANLDLFNPATVWPQWWGLMILCAALGGLWATAQLYNEEGRFGIVATANLTAAVVVAAVGVVALLGVDWNLLWPIVLIVAGCLVLLSVFRRTGAQG